MFKRIFGKKDEEDEEVEYFDMPLPKNPEKPVKLPIRNLLAEIQYFEAQFPDLSDSRVIEELNKNPHYKQHYKELLIKIINRANAGDEYFINLAKLIQEYTTDLLSKEDAERLIGVRSIQEYIGGRFRFRLVTINDDLTTHISRAGGRKRKHTKRKKSKRRKTRRRR